MKKRRQIKVNDELYWLHCYPIGSNSNYNHMVCVNKVGDLMPIAGMSMKGTDTLEQHKGWAKDKINEYLNPK